MVTKMSLTTSRSMISKMMKTTNMTATRPGVPTVSKITYSTAEDKNVSENTSSSSRLPVFLHTPSKWDKRILVWTKKYPSVDKVPPQIPRETLDKSRNKARIYINLIMGGLTIIASIAMIISGKRAAKRGESVQQMNLDWHKSHKE